MDNLNEFDGENHFDNQDTFERENKDSEIPVKKIHPVRTQLLTVIQLILCVLVIITAIIIKTIGGTLYATVGTWFFDNYNNSVFTGTADSFLSFTDNTSITETSKHSAEQISEIPDNTTDESNSDTQTVSGESA